MQTECIMGWGNSKTENIYSRVHASPSVVNGNTEELAKKKKDFFSHEEKKSRALHEHHPF